MAFNKKEYTALWAKKNPDRIKLAQKKYNKTAKAKLRHKRYRDAHKEERSNSFKKWYLKNRKKMNGLHRRWVKNNKEKSKQMDRKQYARRKGAEGSFTLAEWNAVKKRFNNVCPRCKKSKKLTVDHIIPLSKGGTNYIENIQPLCKSCNCSKNNKL